MVSHVKNNDDNSISPALAFNKSRTRAIRRIGPHGRVIHNNLWNVR